MSFHCPASVPAQSWIVLRSHPKKRRTIYDQVVNSPVKAIVFNAGAELSTNKPERRFR